MGLTGTIPLVTFTLAGCCVDVITAHCGGFIDDRLNRGASSAPGQKKLDRSRPLPKINTLVKGRAPDPLEKHLRQPPHRTGKSIIPSDHTNLMPGSILY